MSSSIFYPGRIGFDIILVLMEGRGRKVDFCFLIIGSCLGFCSWTQHSLLPPFVLSHPLIGLALSVFQMVCRCSSISSSHSAITPVCLNPEFLPSNYRSFLDPIPTARLFFDTRDTFKSCQSLNSRNPLRHFLNSAEHTDAFAHGLTPFKNICMFTTRYLGYLFIHIILANDLLSGMGKGNWIIPSLLMNGSLWTTSYLLAPKLYKSKKPTTKSDIGGTRSQPYYIV